MRLSWLAWALALAVVCPLACGGSSFTTASGDDGGSPGSDAPGGSSSGSGGDGAAGGNDDGGADSAPPAEAGSGEAGRVEGGTADGGPARPPVPCGPQMSCTADTPVCCLGTTGPSCAHQECGCSTQLECASDADCQLPTAVCCIAQVQDAACASQHFVAKCAGACLNGSSHLCDPNSQKLQCIGSLCSTDGSDLQNVGLPSGGVYGVCK